jgi:hypothetical protein
MVSAHDAGVILAYSTLKFFSIAALLWPRSIPQGYSPQILSRHMMARRPHQATDDGPGSHHHPAWPPEYPPCQLPPAQAALGSIVPKSTSNTARSTITLFIESPRDRSDSSSWMTRTYLGARAGGWSHPRDDHSSGKADYIPIPTPRPRRLPRCHLCNSFRGCPLSAPREWLPC